MSPVLSVYSVGAGVGGVARRVSCLGTDTTDATGAGVLTTSPFGVARGLIFDVAGMVSRTGPSSCNGFCAFLAVRNFSLREASSGFSAGGVLAVNFVDATAGLGAAWDTGGLAAATFATGGVGIVGFWGSGRAATCLGVGEEAFKTGLASGCGHLFFAKASDFGPLFVGSLTVLEAMAFPALGLSWLMA